MDAKVVVTGDVAGNVITKSRNNPEYGHIRVEQARMIVDETGFARVVKLSALIPGRIEHLRKFGWTVNQEIPGKVIFKESLSPFNKKDPDRDLKVAGDSGVVCSIDDEPIYRKHFYTLNENAKDEAIAHDNEEEIRAAYLEEGENVDASDDMEFSL